MSHSYKVNVNTTFDFDITSQQISDLDAIEDSPSEFHVLQDTKSYRCAILEADINSKIYKVKVNSNTYNINIFNDLDILIKKMGFEIGSTKKVNDIKAPMPGLILDIKVKTGQEVKEDDALIILEAMKMENVIISPRDGVIKSIAVSNHDTVDKNQLLIEFE